MGDNTTVATPSSVGSGTTTPSPGVPMINPNLGILSVDQAYDYNDRITQQTAFLDHNIWEQKDIFITEFYHEDNNPGSKICNLMLQMHHIVMYATTFLNRCETICHTCFDWTQIHKRGMTSCTCSRQGQVGKARKLWMNNYPMSHKRMKFKTFPMDALNQDSSGKKRYQRIRTQANSIDHLQKIKQDDCEFQQEQALYTNVLSCITTDSIIKLVLNSMKKTLNGALGIFKTDKHTILGTDKIDELISIMKEEGNQELSSSTRDIIQTVLLGQILTESRLIRLQNLKNLTRIHNIVINGFRETKRNQIISLSFTTCSSILFLLFLTYRIIRTINNACKIRDERIFNKGQVRTIHRINEKIGTKKSEHEML